MSYGKCKTYILHLQLKLLYIYTKLFFYCQHPFGEYTLITITTLHLITIYTQVLACLFLFKDVLPAMFCIDYRNVKLLHYCHVISMEIDRTHKYCYVYLYIDAQAKLLSRLILRR